MIEVIVLGMGGNGSIWSIIGRIFSSKETGLQSNHGDWKGPKNGRVVQPICRKRIYSTVGAEIRDDLKQRIAIIEDLREKKSWLATNTEIEGNKVPKNTSESVKSTMELSLLCQKNEETLRGMVISRI